MARVYASERFCVKNMVYVFVCAALCAWVLAPEVAFGQQYYCSVCGRGFSHPGRAKTHVEKKHDADGQVRSYATDGTYISARRPRGEATDTAKRSEAIPYYCKWCNKPFPTHVDAARHTALCPSNLNRKRPPAVGSKSGGTEPRKIGAEIKRPVARPEDDVIILKNGERFVGDVQFMTKDSVKLKKPSGAEITFAKDQVQEILGIRATEMLRAVKEGKGPQVAPEGKKTD